MPAVGPPLDHRIHSIHGCRALYSYMHGARVCASLGLYECSSLRVSMGVGKSEETQSFYAFVVEREGFICLIFGQMATSTWGFLHASS